MKDIVSSILMANPIRINAATLNRPGVFVAQSATNSLPQPLANHAVGYIFGTTPADEYYGEDAYNTFSELAPYEPTQIASVDDYIQKIGGEAPNTNMGALVSHDAVKGFFENVGVNGILYFTRVTPTPETVIDLAASTAGTGYNAFAIKINGRYFGTPIGVNDEDGDEIRVITTTGLDQKDNARDLFEFLFGEGTLSDNFSDFYRVEQTPDEALEASFRFFSKDVRSVPSVERFVAYSISDTTYAAPVDLNTAEIVKTYTSVKQLDFRCVSRDITTGQSVFFVSGSALSLFIEEANTTTPGTYTVASDQDQIIKDFLVSQGVYATVGDIPTGKYIAISKDLVSSVDPANKWLAKDSSYWKYDGSNFVKYTIAGTGTVEVSGTDLIGTGTKFTEQIASGDTVVINSTEYIIDSVTDDLNAVLTTSGTEIAGSTVNVEAVPSGTISNVGGSTQRDGYLPDTVQVFYVNIAGENRAVIVNGANPEELATQLKSQIQSILAEKDLLQYFEVSVIADGSNISDPGELYGAYVPNNGHKISKYVAETGNPYIRPELGDINLSGTIEINSATDTITGTDTKFTTEIAPGDVIVSRGIRFTIASVDSDTSATVEDTTVDISAGSSFGIDKSIPNGFYSHEYVLRIQVTSTNGIVSPILPGANRFGEIDSNVVRLTSANQHAGYESYKLTQIAKAHDFVYAIEQGMNSRILSPGFLFAPEAYSVLSYDADGGVTGDLESKSEARKERIKITQALTRAAEGKIGITEGLTATQHVALIDCGGDELKLTEVQDELDGIKSTVGVPFGHAAYYAPYVRNLDDRLVPASSYVAGIACSRFVNEGFQQPPAGSRYPLRGVTGLRFEISAQQQEVTYALGLNPIRSLPNRGIVTWGARTLSPNPLFRFVNTRVILNVLIDVMNRSFDDILFESIDSAGTIFARVKSISNQILNQFWRQGALYGARPEQAYLSVCSAANNDNNAIEQGTVRLDVFVATSPTLERLLVTITRTPVGQVVQISDSFSRNQERFNSFLNSTNLIL